MMIETRLNVDKLGESVLVWDKELPALRLDLSILPDPDSVLVGTPEIKMEFEEYQYCKLFLYQK